MKPEVERHVQSLIPDYVRGTLDETTRAEIARHTRQCAECQGELDFQRRLGAAFEREPLNAPPPVYFEGMLEEIHRKLPPWVPQKRLVRRKDYLSGMATGMVAALVILWAISVIPWRGGDGTTNPSFIERHRAQMIASRESYREPTRLVFAEGRGIVDSKSEIMKYTSQQLAELGYEVGWKSISEFLRDKG